MKKSVLFSIVATLFTIAILITSSSIMAQNRRSAEDANGLPAGVEAPGGIAG